MSKLAKKLRQVCESQFTPMGFRSSASRPGRQMLLIASLPGGKSGLFTQINMAEVDAVLVHGKDVEDGEALPQIASGMGDVPWGVWVGTMDSVGLKQLREAGGDFFILDSPSAPAVLLEEEELAKVLKVSLSQDKELVGAVGDLPVDAVIIDVKNDGVALTISDLMYCQWLAGLVDKPLLVAAHKELTEGEIRALWEVGVIGVVIEVGGDKWQEVLARQSQGIGNLPKRIKKRKESGPLLPQLGAESETDED